jgi:DNA-binding IclR family transcriptional regulator
MSTVLKALELLDLFTRAQPLIGLSDLARQARLNKATCYRLVTSLCDYGLVEQVGPAREYRLGPAVLRLAALREAQVPTRDAAMPILQNLANATGETAHLSLMMGQALRPLAHAYSATHSTRVMLEDTENFPFHATSSGLATLAFLPESFQRAVLSAPLQRLTRLTETNPDTIFARLETIQTQGWAESRGGYEADVHSIAAPLFDAFGHCIGALSVAAVSTRMTDVQCSLIRPMLIRAATEITALWGGSLPPAIATIWHRAS